MSMWAWLLILSLAAADEALVVLESRCSPENLGLFPKHNVSARLSRKALRIEKSREKLIQLAGHPCVVSVAENAPTQIAADPLKASQHGLSAIRADEGDRFFYHPLWGIRQQARVAILDTGVSATHPDLAGRVLPGYDFVNDDADANDDSGHGTHVAGIVAANADNGIGIRGVTLSGVNILPLKTQNANGGGTIADLVNAIHWALDHDADVLNLSLTTRVRNAALEDALAHAIERGAVVVAASGNDGEEITSANFLAPIGYAMDLLGLIGVGSFDAKTRAPSAFSNFSPVVVEIGAPGSAGTDGITSTWPGGYLALDGTSMAAPHVSAAAALVKAFLRTHGVHVTPAEVETLIAISAKEEVSLNGVFTQGRALDMERLGRAVLQSTWVDATGGFDAP